MSCHEWLEEDELDVLIARSNQLTNCHTEQPSRRAWNFLERDCVRSTSRSMIENRAAQD